MLPKAEKACMHYELKLLKFSFDFFLFPSQGILQEGISFLHMIIKIHMTNLT